MKTANDLQTIVKNGVTIFQENHLYIATFTEDNGDEFELTRSNDLNDLYGQLKGMQMIA
jgi:hypothetical protein